jgi:hypothetical protein
MATDDPQVQRVVNASMSRFGRPLCNFFYDLEPTVNLLDLVRSHIKRLYCFFTVQKGQLVPYLYTVEINGQTYITNSDGDLKPVKKLWVYAFEHAPASTTGYVSLTQTALDTWVVDKVMP